MYILYIYSILYIIHIYYNYIYLKNKYKYKYINICINNIITYTSGDTAAACTKALITLIDYSDYTTICQIQSCNLCFQVQATIESGIRTFIFMTSSFTFMAICVFSTSS